jgi:hypothetical protein
MEQGAGSAFSSERGMMNAEKEVMTLAEIFDFDDGGHGGGRRPQWAVFSVQFSAGTSQV